MSHCEDIICLGSFCNCGEIELPIQSTEDELKMYAKFNGTELVRSVTHFEGVIRVPNIFPENYMQNVYFLKQNGEKLNDTNYSFKINICISE